MTNVTPLRGPLRKKESHLWEREADDHYCEPAWTARRLFEAERFEGVVMDPACGFGNIPNEARRAGCAAVGWDIVPRWTEAPYALDEQIIFGVGDFMTADITIPPDNIVSNPPFKLCNLQPKDSEFEHFAFARECLVVAKRKVALLLPSKWIQGDEKAAWLATTPLYKVLFICPRPSMPPGHVVAAGGKPGNGTTDYAWFIWLRGFEGAPTFGWLRRDG